MLLTLEYFLFAYIIVQHFHSFPFYFSFLPNTDFLSVILLVNNSAVSHVALPPSLPGRSRAVTIHHSQNPPLVPSAG